MFDSSEIKVSLVILNGKTSNLIQDDEQGPAMYYGGIATILNNMDQNVCM